jgi:hypothetical protein
MVKKITYFSSRLNTGFKSPPHAFLSFYTGQKKHVFISGSSPKAFNERLSACVISHLALKGTVSRDFLLLVFFMNQFPPSFRVFHLDRFEFFRKFAEIFASQGASPVLTTPVANLPLVSTSPAAILSTTPVGNLPPVSATPVANFSTIFATGVNDAGGKLPPVSMTPAANNGNNIRLQTA